MSLRVLSVLNAGKESVDLPLSLVDCVTPENAEKWTIVVNGSPSRRRLKVVGGKLRLCAPGMTVVVR